MRLYAQLGKVLYEQTKGDEGMFLKCPELYLAIARLEDDADELPPDGEI